MAFPEEVQLTTSSASNRPKTLGVFIHSTRGGHNVTLEQEFRATIGFFLNPDNEASAHYVVGPSKVCRMVPDEDMAFHARENNRTHLGMEIAQPFIGTPYTEFQYQAAAFLVRRWCDKYGIPMERMMSQTRKGLIGHEDSEQGERDDKSDPGPKFDWNHFLALVRRREAGPTEPEIEARIAELINALGFVTADVANALQRNLDRAMAATTSDERTAAHQGIQSGIELLRANGLAPSDGGAVMEHNRDIVTALAFVTVDIADALQRALDGARTADTDAARAAACEALQAAINTLRAQHP
jgi:N-acetyl-anhydromuramyl-L-alanine amidase AmpD